MNEHTSTRAREHEHKHKHKHEHEHEHKHKTQAHDGTWVALAHNEGTRRTKAMWR